MRSLAPLVRRVAAASLLLPALVAAQDGYRQPPEPIRSILDATPTARVAVSPDNTQLLLLGRSTLPSIAEVAAPYVPMAGQRLNPNTNFPSRAVISTSLAIMSIASGETRAVTMPDGVKIGNVRWSPDGKRAAFAMITDQGAGMGILDLVSGAVTRVGTVRVNGSFGDPCTWMPTSDALLCKTIPASRGAAPQAPTVPSGPVSQESFGRKAPERTYQDLLGDAYDEARFTYFGTSQVAIVSMDGAVRSIGAPAVVTSAAPSPDGRYVLTSAIHTPYSYVVPMGRFPLVTTVHAADGKTVHTVFDRPLATEQSTAFDAVDVGARGIAWRADAPATLAWIEAMDGGDPARTAAQRDRVVTLDAPFTDAPVQHLAVATRVRGVTWMKRDVAMITEYWWKSRQTKTWLFNPSTPGAAPRLLHDRSAEDAYSDPGAPVMTMTAQGTMVAKTTPDRTAFFVTGDGESPNGAQPFLDRVDIATGKATRLWRSQGEQYEEPIAMLDDRGARVLTRRQTTTEPPNYWVRNLVARMAPKQLTTFTDPAPQFAGITSKLITYQRPDGVQLSATLYLPAGYDAARDGRLPFFFWAYPQEFKSAKAAAQVRGSQYLFVRPTGASHLFMLTQGYGVLDGPTMPIVGEGNKEPNDTYVEQLVASAKAAVDKVVDLGVADRDRIGVGGHSYGAFMTANLLAHSNIFRAGIARSGAYNRTLTPFGFQQEERPFWEASQIYSRMSPFTYADSIKTPVLLIHGMNDDNSGTFPIQSERMYAALKGTGAIVRYVQLPGEAHGYLGRESVGHTLAEMVSWLDQFVKPVKPRTKAD
ncbi:MAG: prolyl oligopeptidase family serine peptidase [Gemmatimonadaceae bacterium]|nr:prolyl oligopeptidase family serine peptidase [Gemmatimonadaceae bacterium]